MNEEATRPWVAVGASAEATGRIAGPLRWEWRTVMLVPVTRDRFEITNKTGAAYETAPVGFLASVGLGVSIW